MDEKEQSEGGLRDFDFLIGAWHVRNRRLLKRLESCDTWETFSSTCTCRTVLGGLGNEDEYLSDHWQGFVGMALRFFDREARKWSIFWIDNRDGVLLPPVVGAFSSGTGEFYGPDSCNGKPVLVRYIWSDITETSAHWEQAFSQDEGQSWETNWLMDFTRDSKA